MNNLKVYTLDEVQDKLIGEKGIPERDKFEYELQMDLVRKSFAELSICSVINKIMKLFNYLSLIFISFICISSLSITYSYSQAAVTTEMKSYKMCRIDKANASEYDCRNVVGELLYRKIKVVPNFSITTYPKGKIGENEAVKATWQLSNLDMNNDKDLFIYKFLETDINKSGGTSITIVMRLDYTVQAVIYLLNYDGNITRFTMFDE